jgi:hypothetical protein
MQATLASRTPQLFYYRFMLGSDHGVRRREVKECIKNDTPIMPVKVGFLERHLVLTLFGGRFRDRHPLHTRRAAAHSQQHCGNYD